MSDIERSKEKRVPFYKLFSFADGLDIALMIVGSICAIGNGVSQPVMALLFGSVVDVFGTSDHQNIVHNVSKVCVKILYLALGNGVAACLQGLCWTITGERQVVRLQGLYLKAILRQEIAYFDTKMANEKDTGVMPGDGVVIKDAICEKLGKFIQLLSVFFGGFIFAFMKGWLLALALVSIIPALMIVGISMAISISKLSIHTQAAFSEAKIIVEEKVRAIRTVSSFNGEDLAIAKYNRKLERACAFLIQQRLVSGLGFGMVSIIVFSSYGLAIWYGCKLIIEKGYSGGQIISILGAMIFSGMALSQASPCLNTLAAAQATYKNMFEMIQRRPQIDANDTEGIVMENIKGEIELKDIYFRYPSRPGVEIFSGLSLRIPSERITALVGKSGSGKSTVINLLERFYDPDAGEILIDGINLKKLQLGWLRKQIGLVGQEPVLFATTIKENIVYGKKNATDDEIRVAIESANAAAFIDNLPKGWDTMIGDHGAQLSGGQRQRIAIARVILKNPKVFLLDEATSALDAKSEQTVKDALLKVMTNRTTLVITHRLSSVENADNIAVIHHGKTVEQGTHTELTKGISGLYYHLVCSQGANQKGDVIGMHRHRNVDVTVESQISSTERSLRISRRSNHVNESERTITVDSDGKNDEEHCNVNIKRLASLCKQQLPILLLGSIAASLHGLAFPIFGYLFAAAIKAFYEPHNKLQKDSRLWALMYVVLGSITMLAVLAQHFFFGVASGKLIKQICTSSFKKIIHQEGSWFDDPANSSGAVGARLSTNTLALQSLMGNGLALMVQNIAAILAGLVLAFVVNRTLAAIILALATIVVLQSYIQIKCLGKFSTDAKVLYEEQSQVASDAVRSMKTVASFCAENKVLDLYQRKSVATMKYRFKLGYISSIAIGISRSTFYFANALCFFVGAILVQHHKATVLEVVKVYLALTISAIGVVEASGTASHTKRASGLATSVFEILDSKPKIDSSTLEGLTLPNFVGDIEFRNVSFKYPSRPNVQIFDDLCFCVPNGKTVVVVGESGSGKSTIINLLERFYDVNCGCILLDGIEIPKFNLFWLRQQIGLVSQEPILFNDTIHANIVYGNEGDVGIDKIVAAAKTANAHNFITALPQGYGTLVGDRGVQLSGGQKQRIAIARVIVKDPKIFLLDEATSALDAESENIVQEALNRVIVNKTTVVVTHRLSSIRESDMIAFLRNGVIVEQGRHDELMKIPNGAYATMVVHYMNPHM